MANGIFSHLTGSDLAAQVEKDLTRRVRMRDIMSTCMMKILSWDYHPGCEDLNKVRDTSHFYSAFPGEKIPGEDISEALSLLKSRGFVTLRYPDIENDPEGFIVRLFPIQELVA